MTPLKQQISLIQFSIEQWYSPNKRRRFENRWDQTFRILLIKYVLSVNLHSVTRPIAYYYYCYYYYYYYYYFFFLIFKFIIIIIIIIITSVNKAEVMPSFSVILSFVLSFCKQDNWRTRKQTSTRLDTGMQEVTL